MPVIHYRIRLAMVRLFIFGFMVLIGFAMAKAVYHNSFMGILLAGISLVCGILFLYLLTQAKRK